MKLSPRVLLVISAAAGGGTWVGAPWALAELPPMTVAFGRFALAALLLFAWCRAPIGFIGAAIVIGGLWLMQAPTTTAKRIEAAEPAT